MLLDISQPVNNYLEVEMTDTELFINNKYKRLYYKIINKAQSEPRKKGEGTYYENHHIIPKSLEGSNSNDNLTLLTGREHFICHYLLTKFTEGKPYYKMIYAFNAMKANRMGKGYMNSRLFESIRIELSEMTRKANIGNKYALGYKNGLGNKHTKEWKDVASKRMVGNIHALGNKLSNTTKKQMSLSRRGKKHFRFNEYWVTPYGKYDNLNDAVINGLSRDNVWMWCKNPNKMVHKNSIRTSQYIQSLPYDVSGMTYKDLGFGFENV